jgi:hypothetical protein
MSEFLRFDEKTQEVTANEEAYNLKALKELREKDDSNDKVFYRNALKFIYHVYKKEHIFSNLPIRERKVKTSDLYFNGADYLKYDNDKLIADIVKIYISLEYSQNEWAYQKIKDDIDDTIGSINEIPMKKRKYFDEEVEVEIDVETYFDVPTSDGKTEKRKFKKTIKKIVNIKIDSFIDNSDERMKALANVLKLQDMEEKFRDIIIRERKSKERKGQDMTLLESKFFE